MANEFIIKNGFHSNGNSQITGSLNVSSTLTVNGSAVGAAFPFAGDAQITGSLRISGSFIPLGKATDDSNVIIGKDAAPNITSTSGQNVLIGNEAGGTGTLNNADSNVCIGYQAGYELDGGDNNIAIGNQAGYLMDGPTGTIAIGAQVMRDAINNYGTGIGYYAGRFQRNNPNTIVGSNAGYGVSGQSDARYNALFGFKAGYLLRDGYYNTIIGADEAGENINNGYGNIILGSYAGKNITDGGYNIIIGYSASLGYDVSSKLFIGSGSLATISASLETGDIIFASTASSTYFSGNGSDLTNLQRPITSSALNLSASMDNAGYYFRVGGNVTCSIDTNANMPIKTGAEFEFFQTSSAGNFYITGSGITINSKNGNFQLAGQFSGATLKKVGTNEWDLIGDLG